MLIGDDTVECDGDRIRILRDGVLVASGRWRSGRVIERWGADPTWNDEATWSNLTAAWSKEAEAFVAASSQAAYDRRGVDVTQIDRMLSLTPAERLAVLDGERRAMAELLGDAAGD